MYKKTITNKDDPEKINEQLWYLDLSNREKATFILQITKSRLLNSILIVLISLIEGKEEKQTPIYYIL